MPSSTSPATWAASGADRVAHAYRAGSSVCGHASRPRASEPPAPVGPSASRCARCQRWQTL